MALSASAIRDVVGDARHAERHSAWVLEFLQEADDPHIALEQLRRALEEQADEIDLEDIEDADLAEARQRYIDAYVMFSANRLKDMRARPRVGIGRMAPEQWVALRKQRAMAGAWGPKGDEAIEREVLVREALAHALEVASGYGSVAQEGWAREALAKDPSIVRSALDPALDFYAVHMNIANNRERAVYLSHEADEHFYLSAAQESALARRLEEMTGTRWRTVHVGNEMNALLDENEPIVARNPKSVIASSPQWTNAREKLRSAAATVKKNPDARHEAVIAGAWGPHGDEAYEREVLVRDALEHVLAPAQAKTIKDSPLIVRSLLDPEAPNHGGVPRNDPALAAVVMSDQMFPGWMFRLSDGDMEAVAARLEQVTGTRWRVMSDRWDPNVYFIDSKEPMTKRNPPHDVLREKVGNNEILVEYAPEFGYRAWLIGRTGQRLPISFGAETPQTAREAMALAKRFVSKTTSQRNPHSAQLEDAKAKFEEFHRKKPTKIGEFASSFAIPTTVGELGKAVHVLYRSNKKDPSTGKQPKKPVDYIHEHYAGVKAYQVDNDELEQCDVPDFIVKCDALVLLGLCLGFRFKDDDGEHDAEGEVPLPELYATPCGKALLIVQDKKEVLAMIWGGGLGVWARGIDG